MTTNKETNTTATTVQKKNTVRHTRAIQRDRSKRPMSTPPDEVIVERITELVHPATLAQVATFHEMGLRERVLTLPVMMALILSMIWRQIGSVLELTRIVQQESLLWAEPKPKLTEKAIASRLRTLPAELFWRVLFDLLPQMQKRWQVQATSARHGIQSLICCRRCKSGGKSGNGRCRPKLHGQGNNTLTY